jgi:hypothetical protein
LTATELIRNIEVNRRKRRAKSDALDGRKLLNMLMRFHHGERLAWSWLRYQPESALSCWFRERFGGGGKRLRRIGIVAVARKLLVGLWRFLETEEFPKGAQLKEA